MDLERERGNPGTDGTAVAFAAFVLVHAGCPGGTEEARLDETTLACRCRGCDETRLFGPPRRPA